jgi:hypothetical protein
MLPAALEGAVEPFIIKQAYRVARELAPEAMKVLFLEGDANSKVRMDPRPSPAMRKVTAVGISY